MAGKDLMTVAYETAFGHVELDYETVKNFLVRGNGKVSDKEVTLFIEMCKAQKLNPYVTGEVHLIKFGDTPAQMVVGYDTYKRRADDNPNHLYFESGIVVQRGDEIVKKQGACLYPTETLVGGWCRVFRKRGDQVVNSYKEVGVAEYNKGNAIWKEKTCTMIEKVAISQCLREAYPKDYEGLYIEEELAPVDYDPNNNFAGTGEVDEPITQKDRQGLFGYAQHHFGKDDGNALVKELLSEIGLESTEGMLRSQYDKVMKKLKDVVKATSSTEPKEVPYTEVE